MAGKMAAKKLGIYPDYVDKATNMASNYLKSKSPAPLPVEDNLDTPLLKEKDLDEELHRLQNTLN